MVGAQEAAEARGRGDGAPLVRDPRPRDTPRLAPENKLDLFDAVRDCLRLMLGREPTDAETRGVYDPGYVPRVVETQPDPETPFEFEP